MKLLSFVADGEALFGALSGDGVVTMNGRIGHASLREALAAGALEEMHKLATVGKPDHKLAEIKFLPAIPRPEKILCAGINYRAHAAETGHAPPKQPSMFMRLPDTLVGHEGEMIRPSVSGEFDFEGELAVVIGRAGRHIKAERAFDHVAGYTCFVDGSVRDYQRFSVTAGKNFPGTGPLGPWIATNDEIPNPGRPPQRRRGPARLDQSPHPLDPRDRRLLLRLHRARRGRRDRDRHAARRRPQPHSAALDESGR